VKELAATGFDVLQLSDTIFRVDKILNRHEVVTTTTNPGSIQNGFNQVGSSPPALTFAKLISPGSPVPLSLKNGIAMRQTKPTPWVPSPRGLDSPVTTTTAALETVKNRKADGKLPLCNYHYINNQCPKGIYCNWEHDYVATQEEIRAISFLARQVPCGSGQDCEYSECIYGHHVSIYRIYPPTCFQAIYLTDLVFFSQGRLLHQSEVSIQEGGPPPWYEV
jgi:hypothetical protein